MDWIPSYNYTKGEDALLEAYGHGGDWHTADERYGRPERGWLDFSANMNPLGPPAIVETVVKEHWREIARYPDPAARGLRRKLSRRYGISEASIVVGNGAAELIDAAVRTLGTELGATLLPQPSFSEYGEALRKAGAAVKELRLAAVNGFELDAASASDQSAGCGTVFLGHPNNPTGRLVPADTLRSFREAGIRLLVDEAFIDFIPEEDDVSLICEAAETDRIIVFRSMTKFYSVPGIRLGFLVTHPDLAARIRALLPPWSVNFLAQKIGEAVLDEAEYAERTREWLSVERPRLSAALARIGCTVFPGVVNYILASLPAGCGFGAKDLQRKLAAGGILIRDASLFEGLDHSYFRVAVRLRVENDRLVAGLEQALAQERRERT